MLSLLKFLVTAFLIAGLTVLTLWVGLALWYKLPFPEIIRMVAVGGFALFGLLTVVALFRKRPVRALTIYGVAFIGVFMWWGTITPPHSGDWDSAVARQVTGVIDNDILTLTNVREFEWRSEDDYSEIWTTRSYDLSQIQSLDLFMTYWGGPTMAHVLLSFGFETGENLVWSVEVRREVGSEFHPVPDFFKTHTRINIASVERDVVGVRANIRGHDAKLYRLNTSPELARALVEEFVRDSNALAKEPQFFHSLTANCTTAIAELLQDIGVSVPFDWRLVANGYLPSLLYNHGLMDTRLPLAQLRDLGRINTRAEASGLTDAFSAAVRQGVPVPEI